MTRFFIGLFLFLNFALLPFSVAQAAVPDEKEGAFQATVTEIVREETREFDDGSKTTQQEVRLIGSQGKWKDREIIFDGISDIVVSKSVVYKKGDRVVVNYFVNPEGEVEYYITDFVRTNAIYFLVAVFVAIIILVSRWKGLAALISLALSFLIIMKVVLPMILSGYNPLLIAVIGSFLILLSIIYITEGYSKKSNFAIISIAACLVITVILSYLFTHFSRLSGMAQEEVLFMIAAGKGMVNFQGLLLAGIVIGTLGVLDDIVVSQVEAVNQIKKSNPKLSRKQILQMANRIGHSHLGAITNTLFLAYAGASLPLLILFTMGSGGFTDFNQVINSEIVATEIVRTLVGVVGLTLSVPITNLLMVYFYHGETEKVEITKEPRFAIYKKIKQK